jgi:hypothetical protein
VYEFRVGEGGQLVLSRGLLGVPAAATAVPVTGDEVAIEELGEGLHTGGGGMIVEAAVAAALHNGAATPYEAEGDANAEGAVHVAAAVSGGADGQDMDAAPAAAASEVSGREMSAAHALEGLRPAEGHWEAAAALDAGGEAAPCAVPLAAGTNVGGPRVEVEVVVAAHGSGGVEGSVAAISQLPSDA